MTTRAPLVITGCGVVSPAGIGLEALTAQKAGPAEPPAGDYPPIPLAVTPDLRVEDYLGKKGIRTLDRTTRLALVASNRALATLDTPLSDEDRARTGVAIGTSTGSIRSSTEFSRETLIREKPYLVQATLFPPSVMNFCASQIAIWNRLRGVNATIADGRVSGLGAVGYARNAIIQGHIDRALVGAVEELCPQSAWAWHLSGALAPGAAVGEGAAVFVMESAAGAAAAGRTPLAEVLACEVGTLGMYDLRQGLATCVGRALERGGVPGTAVTAVSLSASALRGLRAAEEAGVRRALGGPLPPRVRTAAVLSESFSATAALQLADVLAAWRGAAIETAGDVALVVVTGDDGNVGC
ncbi:hypothetical protein ITP53_53215, partial [Nonomuraea sp. K274]